MQRLAGKMGEGVMCVDDLRREQRLDGRAEKLADIVVLVLRQLAHAQALQPFCAKLPLHAAEDTVAPLIQGSRCRIDPLELLLCGQTGFVVYAVAAQRGDVAEAADADHIEFIEIARENGEKFHALQQGDGLVLRLLKHAGVELQPRKLPVLRVALFPDRFRHGVCSFPDGLLHYTGNARLLQSRRCKIMKI